LNCRLLAMPGYPFPFEYEQSYAWQGEGLDISLIAKNIGDRTAPFGYGAHPYLAVGHRLIDETTLQVQANRYFEVDEHLTPIEPASSVDGTPFDFRQPRPIGATKLDVTLAELARDDEGRIVVNYRSADSSISITCRYYEPIKFIQLFSGDTLPMYRRRSLAIEPYTCLPNAFNNGIGLIHIPPGGAVRVHWTLGA
jgi:aldose 1-epimerase